MAEQPVLDVLIVDVGGGPGENPVAFKERFPEVHGILINQDTAAVINSIDKLPSGIEGMVHDFFKPQPIRNAKIYILGHIIHDWPDKQAKIILQNIRDAMSPTSVLLLDEMIMPERDAPFVPTVADLMMMAGFSSLQRTEHQLQQLLDKVGLKLAKIWRPDRVSPNRSQLGASIVEARIK